MAISALLGEVIADEVRQELRSTDKKVNQITPALFAEADTPEKMVALGEERLKQHIKTIGLFNTKAKNVIALATGMAEGMGVDVYVGNQIDTQVGTVASVVFGAALVAALVRLVA